MNDWNTEHYSQIKISVEKSMAAAFRSACAANGVSMACVLKNSITEFLGGHVRMPGVLMLQTRRQRKAEMSRLITNAEKILDRERQCLDRVPDNFQNTEQYEQSCSIITALEETVDALKEVYN